MATTVLLNQTVTKTPDQPSGGDFGQIIGTRADQTIGFYGSEGITKPAAPADFAALVVLLRSWGLIV